MVRLAVLAVAIAAAAAPAVAMENYIPLGQNYSPDDSVLPDLNSYQDQLNANVDIWESQRQAEQRFQLEQANRMIRFQTDQELTGGNYFIDY